MVLQRLDVPPKSRVPFVDGRTLELILELKVTVSEVASPRVTLPPTFKFFSIPTPPSTINAPVSLFVESVVFDIVVIPETVN